MSVNLGRVLYDNYPSVSFLAGIGPDDADDVGKLRESCEKGDGPGDTLFLFLVREFADLHDVPHEALDSIRSAIRDLQSVEAALERAIELDE